MTADPTFTIEIPDINLSQTIITNVDPTNQDSYLSIMDSYVAHGKYSALPSKPDGNVYLFAHSQKASPGITPAGGWFTRIDELTEGDIIKITYHGQIYTYSVTRTFIVNPHDTYVYRAATIYPEHRSITLQTCYPRGETSQRLIVWGVER